MSDELRLAACNVAGLDPALADRLNGETAAELVTDAEKLAALAKPSTPAEPALSIDGGTRREPSSGGWSESSIRALARKNPRKLNELLDNGTIDLSRVR